MSHNALTAPRSVEFYLSQQERETLHLVANDLTDHEIAEELGLSVRTVNNRLSQIYLKLGVKGRAGAVVMALARGIIDLPKIA